MDDKNNNGESKVVSDFDSLIKDLPTANQSTLPKTNADGEEKPLPEVAQEKIEVNPLPKVPEEASVTNVNESVSDNVEHITNDDTNLPKFNNNESTIGKIKPDKQKSPLAMIILFGILVIFIIFMPQIIELANKYLGTNLNANTGVIIENTNNTSNNTTNTVSNNENVLYSLTDDLSIKMDDLQFMNFKKVKENNKYTLTFDIKNNGSSSYKFTKKLYLEFYNSNSTFISRTLLDYSDSISSSATVNVSANITSEDYETGYKLALILRSDDDYPNVTLSNNLLTCSNDNDKILYYFLDSKLIKINETLTYVKGSDAILYNNDLMNYKQTVSKLDALDGVESALTETENGFIISLIIDYNTATYSALSYKTNIYDKNTLASVISFEMGAKYYSCK